jgi:hypothetical protein
LQHSRQPDSGNKLGHFEQTAGMTIVVSNCGATKRDITVSQ